MISRINRRTATVILVIAVIPIVLAALRYIPLAVGLLPGLCLLSLAVVTFHSLRLPIIVVGGLTILYTSSDLSAPKEMYLTLVALSVAAAIVRLIRAPGQERILFPALVGSALFALVLLASLPVALGMMIPFKDWLRDTAPYWLIASVPLLVIDAHPLRSGMWVTGLFIAGGLLCALSFDMLVLTRRESISLGFDHIVVPSFTLATAAFYFAIGHATNQRGRRIAWLMVAAALLALGLATGTRTVLGLLPGVGIIGLVAARQALPAVSRRQVLVVMAVSIVLVAGVGIAMFALGTLRRFEAIPTFVLHPGSDLSYQERAQQTQQAWRVFLGHPWLGAGPGHRFTWKTWNGASRSTFNIDTSLSLLAKLGIVGLLSALTYSALIWRSVAQLGPSNTETSRAARLGLLGFALAIVAVLPLASPAEDKGFSFALMFLLLLVTLNHADVDDASRGCKKKGGVRTPACSRVPADIGAGRTFMLSPAKSNLNAGELGWFEHVR